MQRQDLESEFVPGHENYVFSRHRLFKLELMKDGPEPLLRATGPETVDMMCF